MYPLAHVRSLLLSLALSLPHAMALATPPEFDAQLAASLGADEYGMSAYVLVLLSAGDTEPLDADTARGLQAAHLAHIRALAEDGRLVLAGPFYGGVSQRGLFVLDTSDLQQARAWVDSDPLVAGGHLRAELLPWYGTAALRSVNATHARIARQNP